VFENTDLAITLFDNDFKIVSFNTNAKELAIRNYHKKLKVGNSAFKYFDKNRKTAIKQIRERIANKEMVCYESQFVLKNGTTEWYDVKWVSVDNYEKEIVGIIMTLKNITEKKSADIERDKITADLIQRNKDLEQFTYIVSHNLRAPVANILGLSNLLLHAPGEENMDEELKALSNSIHNLDKIILDLNQVLQAGNMVNDTIEVVALPDLIEEIRSGISNMIDKNNVNLTWDFSAVSHLPGLKSYFYSILQNLVINSIKYQTLGTAPVIHISSKVSGNKIIISIKDNGRGIDLDRYGDQLFGLYKRFDYSVEGKGMGLFMVKMQVESLGGTIRVNSVLGKGTEFTLGFPLG
jgi:PAS domain S-box-containing protein